MITADFTILPIGNDTTSCKEYVSIAVQIIKDSGLNYQLTGMGTLIEAENLHELYDVLAKAQEAIFKAGISRIYTVVKIDDRRDKDKTLNEKAETVSKILK